LNSVSQGNNQDQGADGAATATVADSGAATSGAANAKAAPVPPSSAGQAASAASAATAAARPVVVADQDPQKEAEAVIDGAQADDAKQSDGAKENS